MANKLSPILPTEPIKFGEARRSLEKKIKEINQTIRDTVDKNDKDALIDARFNMLLRLTRLLADEIDGTRFTRNKFGL